MCSSMTNKAGIVKRQRLDQLSRTFSETKLLPMLPSEKQWRRPRSVEVNLPFLNISDQIEENDDNENEENEDNEDNEDLKDEDEDNGVQIGELNNTSTDNSSSIHDEEVIITPRSRNVSFHDKLRLILIPCRQEYRSCGLHHDLWWQPRDYLSFKNDSLNEKFFLTSSLAPQQINSLPTLAPNTTISNSDRDLSAPEFPAYPQSVNAS